MAEVVKGSYEVELDLTLTSDQNTTRWCALLLNSNENKETTTDEDQTKIVLRAGGYGNLQTFSGTKGTNHKECEW